jgi:hypothetical protein
MLQFTDVIVGATYPTVHPILLVLSKSLSLQ